MKAGKSRSRMAALALQIGAVFALGAAHVQGSSTGPLPGGPAGSGPDPPAASADGAGESPGFTLVEVSPSAVVARHPYGANITCIALDGGLIFLDAGMSTEMAARFRRAMEKRFDRKTTALLLTHAHIDHFLGMGAFSDVAVVAAEAGRDLFEKQLKIEFDEARIEAYTRIFPKFREAIGSAKPFLPTLWFKEQITFGGARGRLVFTHTGGHSSCSSFAHFEPEGVIVAGDLVQVDQYPYFGDPSTDLQAWIGTLARWETLKITGIAPGHGRIVDRDYVPRVRRYFEEMISTLKQLKAEGVPEEEAIHHPRLPKKYWDDDLPEPKWWSYCIVSLYRSL